MREKEGIHQMAVSDKGGMGMSLAEHVGCFQGFRSAPPVLRDSAASDLCVVRQRQRATAAHLLLGTLGPDVAGGSPAFPVGLM